jgi:RNA polymerase subunit RPABC4/transcription elongation factor Spt4
MEANLIALLAVLGGTLLAIIWASLIVWTYRDIRDRTRDMAMQVLSIFLVMAFPLFGLLVYLILRPRETLDEAYARYLEEEALLRELGEDSACPSCRHFVENDFLFCPHCQTQLRQPCPKCNRPLSFSWVACPYCGSGGQTTAQAGVTTTADVEGEAAPQSARSRQKATAEASGDGPAVASSEATQPGAAPQ